MHVYKTDEGKETIRGAVREVYACCPVPAEPKYLDTGAFGSTHCLVMGPDDGPPLVLLHGSGSNSAAWLGYVTALAGQFRILALDIPGHPGLSDERPLSPEGGCRRKWLGQAVKELGINHFFICGMSLGSWFALDYGIAFPAQVRGMCLLSTGGIVPPRFGFFLRILPFLFLGERGRRAVNRIVHGPLPVDPAVDEFSFLLFRHYRHVREELPIFKDEQLGSIPFPLLYIGGEQDVMLKTRETARRIRKQVPHAEIEVIQDAGHVLLGMGRRVERFFRSCD